MSTLIGWILSGLVSSGVYIRYFQTKYSRIACIDYINDLIFGLIWFLFGPIGLVIILFWSIAQSYWFGWGFNHVCPNPSRCIRKRK